MNIVEERMQMLQLKKDQLENELNTTRAEIKRLEPYLQDWDQIIELIQSHIKEKAPRRTSLSQIKKLLRQHTGRTFSAMSLYMNEVMRLNPGITGKGSIGYSYSENPNKKSN